MDTRLNQHPHRAPRGAYRRHTLEFKRAVVEQSLQPGVSVSRLARLHDVNANQIFSWRKAYREGCFAGSDTGGERAVAIYSLIGTAKLGGLDPEVCLHHVLGRIAEYPVNRVAELLPWRVELEPPMPVPQAT